MDKQIFGKVMHFIGSKEEQKRGMIHGHLLVRILEMLNSPLNHEWVDRFISAHIPPEPAEGDTSPAAERARRLRKIVCKQNLHDCDGMS